MSIENACLIKSGPPNNQPSGLKSGIQRIVEGKIKSLRQEIGKNPRLRQYGALLDVSLVLAEELYHKNQQDGINFGKFCRQVENAVKGDRAHFDNVLPPVSLDGVRVAGFNKDHGLEVVISFKRGRDTEKFANKLADAGYTKIQRGPATFGHKQTLIVQV